MKIKILAEKVTYRGGVSLKGETPDVPADAAEYFIANGYAEPFSGSEPADNGIAEVGKKKVGRPRKKKEDDDS